MVEEGGVLNWIHMEECGLLVDLVMPILENIVSLAPSRSKDSASGSRGVGVDVGRNVGGCSRSS